MPGAPPRLLDVDSTVFLAFVEGLVREGDTDAIKALDRLYEERVPKADRPSQSRADRVRDIERFTRLSSGGVVPAPRP